ncbi:MAG: hypothetical protein ACM3JH_14535 [Acidithiobacillales bacterium]
MLARAWDFRQRRHARGVWFRLRRVLADASAAWVISDDDARRLVSEDCRPESVGAELEPPKLILFATAEQISRLPSARAVPVRLGGELLAARCLALARFGT